MFAQLANRCLHSNPKQRPTMVEVVVGLESILAAHEKASDYNTLIPMYKKIFGRKVPTFLIPSNLENSVGISKSLDIYLYIIGGEDRILRRFDFKTIVDATENFSQANEVQGDTFERYVYKGRLQNGQHITVAQYQYGQEASASEYKICMDEASIHIKLEHENLLRLLGYCIEGTNVCLIYDFAPYATLHHLLFDPNRAPSEWNARNKIIVGVARALVYLHNHAPIHVIHLDVKPGNIWLDESLEPKLFGFDFALSKAINDTSEFEWVRIGGTLGYMAPEYAMRGDASAKGDVYSFGVSVLEAITGYEAIGFINESEERLEKYVWRNWMEGTCSNIFDPRITIDGDMTTIIKLVHIGLLCVQYETTDRPTMKEVVDMLLGSSSAPLPIPKKPLSTPYAYKLKFIV